MLHGWFAYDCGRQNNNIVMVASCSMAATFFFTNAEKLIIILMLNRNKFDYIKPMPFVPSLVGILLLKGGMLNNEYAS